MLTKHDGHLIEEILDRKLDARFEKFEEKIDEKFEKFEEKMDIKFDAKFKKFEEKIDEKFEKFEEKIDEKFEKFYNKIHDDIASYKDKIFGVVNPLQEDHDVLAHQTGGVRDDVSAIHTRVQSVERVLKLPVGVLPSLSV